MKKIIVLISGRLKYLSDQNFLRIKKIFKDFDLDFFLTPWENEDISLINKFAEIYKPIAIKKISQSKFENKIKLIKYPDNAGSMEGFFYNWEGICKGLNEINLYFIEKNSSPDYVLRYRSDILPDNNSIYEIKNKTIYNKLIIPDRYHWNGINDQIFLFEFNKIKIFKNFFDFVDSHIQQNRFFSGEFIFYRFLKNNKLDLIYNNFDYKIMREKNFQKKNITDDLKSKIPLRDNLLIKLNKLMYKIRNFKEFYILKNKRNKYQDMTID